MRNFLKTYSQLFEQEEGEIGSSQPLFDEYPEALKKDMAKFVKFFNKNVLQQVKCKVNSLNFEKRKDGITYIRSTDIISTQLGVLGLVTDKATILIKLTLDDVKKEARGNMFLCLLNQEIPFADILLKNGHIMYASLETGDFVSVEVSEYAIGPSSETVD
jgi:hypothetical protein